MNAAVISMGSLSSKWVAAELKNFFSVVDFLDIRDIEVSLGVNSEVLNNGKKLPYYDCIYAKGSFRYATLLRSLTALLQPNTYLPIPAAAFTVGHDKLLTHLKLQAANIPMPTTYVVATADAARKLLKKISYPVVMKIPSGTHGKGVMLADSYESASSMVDALALLRQPFLLQEYVETSGVDTRAFVIGDKVVASMQRTAASGEKRANIHSGGVAKQIVLDVESQRIALAAAHACSCDIVAIDLLMGPNGPLVIEINLSPGLQGITKATGVNVAKEIASYLFERAKEKKVVVEPIKTIIE